jgi:prephenate dehydrogenase
VVGLDRPPVVRQAVRLGVVTRGRATSPAALREVARDVDLVVLAAPPSVNVRLLRVLAGAPSHPVITDVGSVKGPIVAEARRLGLRRFVGGHPIAGNEGRGLESSAPDLFRGRAWALVPGRSDAAALSRVRALVRAVGARPVLVDARAHDRALAFLSHLPQLAAWALEGAARGDRVARAHLDLAGPGFRDMTRLARSPRGLWADILRENAAEVDRARRALRRALARG